MGGLVVRGSGGAFLLDVRGGATSGTGLALIGGGERRRSLMGLSLLTGGGRGTGGACLLAVVEVDLGGSGGACLLVVVVVDLVGERDLAGRAPMGSGFAGFAASIGRAETRAPIGRFAGGGSETGASGAGRFAGITRGTTPDALRMGWINL